MVSRRFLVLVTLITTAASFFLLGAFHARSGDAVQQATYAAQLDAIRTEMRGELAKSRGDSAPEETSGKSAQRPSVHRPSDDPARASIVAEVKQELQSEMGLLPVHLLRERRASFVELYSTDSFGKTNY